MNKIIEILNEIKPGIDYENETHLISNHILDSMSIVSLVVELSNEFDVTITPIDIVPENFESVEAIKNLIIKLDGEI